MREEKSRRWRSLRRGCKSRRPAAPAPTAAAAAAAGRERCVFGNQRSCARRRIDRNRAVALYPGRRSSYQLQAPAPLAADRSGTEATGGVRDERGGYGRGGQSNVRAEDRAGSASNRISESQEPHERAVDIARDDSETLKKEAIMGNGKIRKTQVPRQGQRKGPG